MGFDREVEMIARAHELDMLTCPYVFNPDEAKAMAEACVDLLIAHRGLTTKGSIGAKTALALDESVSAFKPSGKLPFLSAPTFWFFVIAARLRSRTMCNMFSTGRMADRDSSGRRASSACPPSVPSLSK
jgi:hypothetical protein